jgi:hypothetical protein
MSSVDIAAIGPIARPLMEFPALPRFTTGGPAIPFDRVATLLAQLATPEFCAILTRVETRLPVPDHDLVERVLNEASSAVLAGNPQKAADKVTAFIRAYPPAVYLVPADPKLEVVHQEIANALRALTTEMRRLAEQGLTEAAAVLPWAPASIDGVAPWTLLAVAARLTESPSLPDLVRARALAELVTRRPGVTGSGIRESVERVRTTARAVWRRAPLLVLLFAWLAAGLCGLLGLEWWPLGLLGLVGLGFYARIRRVF